MEYLLCVCPGRMEGTGMELAVMALEKIKSWAISKLCYVAQKMVEAIIFLVDIPQSRLRAILCL